MCSVKCMYDLPYEMQYELYSDMVKQLYCGSYSIAHISKHIYNAHIYTAHIYTYLHYTYLHISTLYTDPDPDNPSSARPSGYIQQLLLCYRRDNRTISCSLQHAPLRLYTEYRHKQLCICVPTPSCHHTCI